MAKRTEGVTEKLLLCAKEEFLEKGYENASLRAIAERAGSSKGAIYIRYADKAELFRALVEDSIKGLLELIDEQKNNYSSFCNFKNEEKMKEWSDIGFMHLIDYLYDNFDVFKLVLCCSDSQTYNTFIHDIVEADVEATVGFIEATNNDAITSGRLTNELAHLLSQAFYTGVFEVIIHDMAKEDAKSHINKLRAFYFAGWMTIFYPEE